MNRFLNITLSNVSLKWPEWRSARSFNLGVGSFSIGVLIPGRFYRSLPVWLYNAFRRVYDSPQDQDGNCWGFGILQVSGRHLLAVISNAETFEVDVAFIHLIKRTPTPLPSDGEGS